MAKNNPYGDSHRHGAVRERTKVYNPKTEQWVKRDTNTGQFIDAKQDGNPFKGVKGPFFDLVYLPKQVVTPLCPDVEVLAIGFNNFNYFF